MFSNIKNLYAFVDTTVESIYQQHPNEINCQPGCADCCHAAFDISFIEAAYLASFLAENSQIITAQQAYAKEAAAAYEKMLTSAENPATTRIRCPLLADDNLCLAHPVRPINCRTYGTPTVINGKAHVCGLSGFDDQSSYPTIDLAPLQKSLQQYSVELVGDEIGNRRFPIAWVLLKINYFLPS